MKKIVIVVVVFAVFLLTHSLAMAQLKVSIINGEKIQQINDLSIKVKLPFDEEYKIRLNNTDSSRRALLNITIDGRKVTGNGLILRLSELVDLERFLDAGSLIKGKKFKFIPKTDEPLRPDKQEDGIITISVQYEKTKKPLIEYGEESAKQGIYIPSSSWGDVTFTSKGTSATSVPISDYSEQGITVEGSKSSQRFQKEEVKDLEDRIDTLTIQLVGYYKKPPILVRP